MSAQAVAWLCRWQADGETHELLVWSTSIEDARQQARDHSAGARAAVAARIATRRERGEAA